ncbi:hypothetical protein PROFUN_04104 [Planoprotostelium fungivorum]|uniref:Uncharacterized protein n=1 Tax=Planoprotostelium fungivorum TaxID=1890364 RepID=A0A2P6NJG8_9EUKA|nr:hypothetical protein PROFUN_04104 [Planoprotostelium fungivorum]
MDVLREAYGFLSVRRMQWKKHRPEKTGNSFCSSSKHEDHDRTYDSSATRRANLQATNNQEAPKEHGLSVFQSTPATTVL